MRVALPGPPVRASHEGRAGGPLCIDLLHVGLDGAIAAYLVAGKEPTLVDPGPETTFERLCHELAEAGIGPRDLRHVALTHVHLDHAGCTGRLLEAFPDAVVHVHIEGAVHMADPARLVASTRRTFGEAHDRLWGETRAVPRDRIRPWSVGDPGPWRGLRSIPTPGHISHHLAYLDESDGTLFAGDSMGIVMAESAPTHPPTPPPSLDLRAWETTLDHIRSMAPERFGATHFGLHGDVPARVEQLRERLGRLERRVRRALAAGAVDDAQVYEREVHAELALFCERERVDRYFESFSAARDWAGVKFYVEHEPR